MGYALHPLQDFVAHGDFNRWRESPYASSAIRDSIKYIHNTLTPQAGRGYNSVDDPNLDSEGSDGRATFSVLQFATITSVGDWLFWARFNPGTSRIQFTERITLNRLREFMEHVRQNAAPCGQCYNAFVNELPTTR